MTLAGPAFPNGWLFRDEESVPEQWRERAMHVVLVPLLPDEIDTMLAAGSTDTTSEDERFMRLVAAGRSRRTIASEMHVSLSSVDRKIARLAERFGCRSDLELVAVLARSGL